jgi:uncharacterized protein (TIGR04255 family)
MQFTGLPVKATDVAAFYALLASDYPKTLDVIPLPPTFEPFGPGAVTPFAFNAPGSMLPRSWFISENDEHVVQFQTDKLIANWRMRPNGGQYPRYPEVRRRFVAAHEALATFCHQKGMPPLVPNQCDLTYYNKVPLPEGATWADFGHLLRGMDLDRGPEWQGKFSVGQMTLIRDIQSDGQPTLSRLQVDCMPIQTDAGRRAWGLNFAVKGRPAQPTVEAVLEFLDSAHVEIINCFAAITTETIQAGWGRLT